MVPTSSVSRRGSTLIQGLIAIAVLCTLTSLTVDIGLYHAAKAELQHAADAAALAGAAVLEAGQGDLYGEAVAYARSNKIAGEILPQAAIAVQVGTWQNGVFTSTGSDPTTVRVTLQRSQAHGNPVRLFFSQMIGLTTVDIKAVSIAQVAPKASPFNFVGIDEVRFSSLGVLARIKGRVVSNGDVRIGTPLGLLVGVQGDARSYAGQVSKGTLAGISGSTQPLEDELVYPSVQIPATSNNDQIASCINAHGDFNSLLGASIPAGTYVVRDLNILAGIAVRIEGPVTFYVERNCNLAAGVNLLGNSNFDPEMFKVRVAPGGSVNFLANLLTPMNMDLYAPDSDVNIAVGVNRYYGRLVAKKLWIGLPLLGEFEEDATLGDPEASGPKLKLVK